MKDNESGPNRRGILLGSTVLAATSVIVVDGSTRGVQAQPQPARISRGPPNIVYFLVDNLGYGELGCYGGGILRGADTRRIDAFAEEGMKLLNFARPKRSARLPARP